MAVMYTFRADMHVFARQKVRRLRFSMGRRRIFGDRQPITSVRLYKPITEENPSCF